jgi:peptidoglycan hydrolase-like protein with peptidoglycan-binding domain
LIGFDKEQQERLQIANVQSALLKLGFDVGTADGILGSKTTTAIKAFQKKQHLEEDGKISGQLLKQLKTAIEHLPPADFSQPSPAAGQ